MARRDKYPQLIMGPVLTPCFMSEEEFEEGYKKSMFYVDKDFKNEYQKHIAGMSHIANIAKSYILKNWKSVEDWSDLEVVITDGRTGKSEYYYSFKERISKRRYQGMSGDIFRKFDQERKRKQKPVVSIDEVILDPTDGDFSITLNGKEYWWIQDEAIIVIADYIEKKLTKQNEEKE